MILSQRRAILINMIVMLMTLFTVAVSLLSPSIDSSNGIFVDIIDVRTPRWILLNRTETVTVTIENKVYNIIQVEVIVKSVYNFLEVLYPVQNYTVRIPSRERRTFTIALKGVREGEDLVVITVSVPAYEDKAERILKIPVLSADAFRTIDVELYASFKLFQVEIYKRPKTAEVYICGLKASYLRDNLYKVEIPRIYRTCDVNVSYFFLKYEFRDLLVEDKVNLVIPDLGLLVYSIILSWVLLIPYYVCRYLSHRDSGATLRHTIILFMLLAIFTILTSFGLLELYLPFYLMVFEVLFIIFPVLKALQQRLVRKLYILEKRLVRKLSMLKKSRLKKPIEEIIISGSSSISRDNVRYRALDSSNEELLQRLLRTRIRNPPKKEYVETYVVPAEFKSFLKIELPNEMHLIGCGTENCVFACGEYAIKIPRTIAMEIKAGSRAYLTMKQKALESVKKEVEKAYNLDHENVIKLIDYSINPPILVYELADGSLEDYDKLDLKNVLLIAIQLSEALRYLHSRGLVHGDLKPSNILVSKGVVKIGDLSSITFLLRVASGSGLRVCTAGYCAPEQIYADLKRDPRTKGCENKIDIYQLANVILTMLKISPLDGSHWSEEEVEERLNRIEIVELRGLLKRMLSREPWLRPSAEEVEKSLVIIWKKTFGVEKRLRG